MKWLKYKLVHYSIIQKERLVSIGFVFVDNTDLTAGKIHLILLDTNKITEEIQNTIDIFRKDT